MLRNQQKITINSYSLIPDSLGQLKKTITTSRQIDAYCKVYSQTNTQDPRYVECDFICLTKDKGVTDENMVVMDNVLYNVLKVIPSARYYQILIRRTK